MLIGQSLDYDFPCNAFVAVAFARLCWHIGWPCHALTLKLWTLFTVGLDDLCGWEKIVFLIYNQACRHICKLVPQEMSSGLRNRLDWTYWIYCEIVPWFLCEELCFTNLFLQVLKSGGPCTLIVESTRNWTRSIIPFFPPLQSSQIWACLSLVIMQLVIVSVYSISKPQF